MDHLLALYQRRFNLKNAVFSRVDHEDAMVAVVYKVEEPGGKQSILKISSRSPDYFREVYFLKYFASRLPVPRLIDVVPPETGVFGAILMESLPGTLLKSSDFTDELAFQLGSLLAHIHLNGVAGFGDLVEPDHLSSDPRDYFTMKFLEGLEECSQHLPNEMLKRCRSYFDRHIHLLATVDGPCMIHRDFRPGNVIVHEGKLQGIIDWAGGRASFAEEDFCPLEHGEWPTHPSSKKSFLAGYSTVRPFTTYNAIMPLLRMSKAIATIGFTVKRGTWQTNHSRIYKFNRQFLEMHSTATSYI